ncbi:hypothetical protein DL96DRAFT_1017380 [Flagelloscypha sp. PMI_526]|nr:hypothetical protein DL96DRAFT_1017380 [Flagelloscypha sp. PMI_526]
MSTPPSRKRKADACFPLATVSKRPRIKAPESWEINDSPAILTITNATTPRSLGEVAIKRLRILVLDGEHSHSSGVLSALEVLRELITRVGYDIGDNNVAPWKLFDLIVGSGDGGWVALMLGRLRMSIAQIIEEYQRIHEQIYHMTSTTSAEERAILFDGLLKDLVARYSTTKNPDEPLLSPLSETECLTVVLAMARENMAFPVLFRTYSARNFSFVRSCSVRSAVRAATSFSPLFPELTLDGQNYVSASRFGHCNPITTALSEAQMMFPGAEISSIVSIGCGHPGPISYSDTFPGAAAFMLANDAERQSSQADKYFQTQRGKVYFRFNVDQGFQAFCLGHGKKYCEALAHTRAYCARTEVSDRLNAAILCLSSSQTSQSEKTIFQSSHCPTSCSSSGVASINSSVLDPRLQLLLTSLRQVDFGDYELTDEVVTRPNYSFHYGRIISTNKRVLVQRFEGRHASERKRRSLQGNLIGKQVAIFQFQDSCIHQVQQRSSTFVSDLFFQH